MICSAQRTGPGHCMFQRRGLVSFGDRSRPRLRGPRRDENQKARAGPIVADRRPRARPGGSRLRAGVSATTAIASMDVPAISVPLLDRRRLDFGEIIGSAFSVGAGRFPSCRSCRRGQQARCRNLVARIREESSGATSDPKQQRMRGLLIVAALAVMLLRSRRLPQPPARSVAFGRPRLLPRRQCRRSASRCRTPRYAPPLPRQAFIENVVTRAAAIPNVNRRVPCSACRCRISGLASPLRRATA